MASRPSDIDAFYQTGLYLHAHDKDARACRTSLQRCGGISGLHHMYHPLLRVRCNDHALCGDRLGARRQDNYYDRGPQYDSDNAHRPNENKMSDSGRGGAWPGVKVF